MLTLLSGTCCTMTDLCFVSQSSIQPCSLTRAALCAPGLADCRGFCAKGQCCCSSTKDGETTARLPHRDRSPGSGWLSSAGTSAKAGWSLGVPPPTHLETARTPSLLCAMGRFLASAQRWCAAPHTHCVISGCAFKAIKDASTDGAWRCLLLGGARVLRLQLASGSLLPLPLQSACALVLDSCCTTSLFASIVLVEDRRNPPVSWIWFLHLRLKRLLAEGKYSSLPTHAAILIY